MIELRSHGFDHREIGEILDETPSAVRVGLHRAIKKLKSHPEVCSWLERATSHPRDPIADDQSNEQKLAEQTIGAMEMRPSDSLVELTQTDRETIRLCDSVRESAGVDQPEADRELRDLIESTLAGTELVETVQAVSPIVETVTRPIRWKHRAAVAASLAGIVAIANEAQNQFH